MKQVKDFLKTNSILVFVVVVALVAMNGCSSFNTMANLNEDVDSSWSQVENVYQRRNDLIPSLVETVKGYTDHEKSTLTEVMNARANATKISIDASRLNESNIKQFEQAQSGLTQALSKLMMVSERYPDLKANEQFKQLMNQLEGTENRITIERKRFNETVQVFNKKVVVMPRRMWASAFGFEKRAYFQADASASKAPKFKF